MVIRKPKLSGVDRNGIGNNRALVIADTTGASPGIEQTVNSVGIGKQDDLAMFGIGIDFINANGCFQLFFNGL